MSHYGDIKDDDPKLTSFDLCRDTAHARSGSRYYSRPLEHHDGKKATVIVATTSYDGSKVTSVGLYCRKHAAADRGAITKGTRGAEYIILIDDADLSSRDSVDAAVAKAHADKLAAKADAKARHDAWVVAKKPQHLVDRLVDRPGSFRVGYGLDDTFGTGTVVLDYRGMTPGQARYLAKQLLKAADKAADVGVK